MRRMGERPLTGCGSGGGGGTQGIVAVVVRLRRKCAGGGGGSGCIGGGGSWRTVYAYPQKRNKDEDGLDWTEI